MDRALTDKQRFWRDHLLAAQASQLSYAQYAKKHSLNLQALYYWSMTLRRKGVLDQPASAFVELKVKPTAQVGADHPSANSSFRARLPNGVVLELEGLNEQMLRWLASL